MQVHVTAATYNGCASESSVRKFIASARYVSSVIFAGTGPSRSVNNCGDEVVYCGHCGLDPPLGSKFVAKWIR